MRAPAHAGSPTIFRHVMGLIIPHYVVQSFAAVKIQECKAVIEMNGKIRED